MIECPAGKCKCTKFEEKVGIEYTGRCYFWGPAAKEFVAGWKRCPYEPVPPSKTPEAKFINAMEDCIIDALVKHRDGEGNLIKAILADIAIQLPRHGFKHVPSGSNIVVDEDLVDAVEELDKVVNKPQPTSAGSGALFALKQKMSNIFIKSAASLATGIEIMRLVEEAWREPLDYEDVISGFLDVDKSVFKKMQKTNFHNTWHKYTMESYRNLVGSLTERDMLPEK